ncbi:PIN domain-containing protein [Larkinella soli]|uniref:PIN domain-containing protein n=1 Tax=Larkinella soli TaxID=1770527 RepID=UPI000FFC86DF|nr:PIN domain-containing protein [Larkinella soli]
MTSRIFIDSSLLVEKAKKSRTDLFDALIRNPNLEKCISATVLSEFTFHLLAIEGGKAPRTLKEAQAIPALLSANPPQDFLRLFTFVPDSSQTVLVYLDLMSKYNLLPNDALILSACVLYEIPYLASYDKADFETPCFKEGIGLIHSLTDLDWILKTENR